MFQSLVSYLARKGFIPSPRIRLEKRVNILSTLDRGERSGRRLRQGLEQLRYWMSGPAFYKMMSEMENEGLVDGWYTTRLIGETKVMTRHYRITEKGRETMAELRNEVAK